MNDNTETIISVEGEERISLKKMGVDEFLALGPHEKEELEVEEYFDAQQVLELWKRRNELSKEDFHIMILSVLELESDDKLCPFSGLEADRCLTGFYGSTWLDIHSMYLHHTMVDGLLNLAKRVGAGVEALELTGLEGPEMPNEMEAELHKRVRMCEETERLNRKLRLALRQVNTN
jgi:hypothetical protein